MCGGSERLNSKKMEAASFPEAENLNSVTTESIGMIIRNCPFSCLLEFAADNDVEGFKRLGCDLSVIAEVGVWYSYQKDLKRMVLEHRTPLMIAARYGSIDIVRLITSVPGVDVNCVCDPEKSTPLHCAASGGSAYAAEVVELLLFSGADVNAIDACGKRPFDVIVAHPDCPCLKLRLEKLLGSGDPIGQNSMQSSAVFSRSSLPSQCEVNLSLPEITCNPCDEPLPTTTKGKKDYLIDPFFPDIKSSIYTTDEFRMYAFKIQPCSRAYSHDWTECPFAHPGENARRRDPRKFHYSCVPCPEFRKGACKNGDICEYAHGVFESWLHPAQYRTKICKDSTSCDRRVCFFAHTNEELRPLYGSTGSGTQSPRSSTSLVPAMDMASALSMFPGSPCANSAMCAPFSPPMSPTGNGTLRSPMNLSQHSVPMLNLPTSRLRSSLNARNIPFGELHSVNSPCPSPPFRSRIMTPSNLDELFSSETLSPRFCDHRSASSVLSPSHNLVLLHQLQQQQQRGMLSPIRTDNPLFHAAMHASSPRGMSPRGVDPLSPGSHRLSTFPHCAKLHPELQSLNFRENVLTKTTSSPADSRPKWSSAEVDWSVPPNDLTRAPTSTPKGDQGEIPDLSWVHSLVKESPSPVKTNSDVVKPNSNPDPLNHSSDQAILGAWLEQLKLD